MEKSEIGSMRLEVRKDSRIFKAMNIKSNI